MSYVGGAIGQSELPWPRKLTEFAGTIWRNRIGMPAELIPQKCESCGQHSFSSETGCAMCGFDGGASARRLEATTR
jgi:ribosomal protein L37E